VKFNGDSRAWSRYSDEELVEYAQKFVDENKIRNKQELKLADGGLHYCLRIRKQIGKVRFKEIRRNWKSMNDDEIVAYAQRFIDENEIKNRTRLARVGGGLYKVLLERKLIDNVFADIELSNQREAVQEVFDAVSEFGDAA
jgi:hypothetical protein